jgi:hypothetical protein
MRLRLVPAAAVVAVLGWAASSPSRPAPAAPAPAPAAGAGTEFEVRFGDDSVVKVALLDPALVVSTKYGKLTVPVAEVRRVELGFRYPDGAEARIAKAVEDLGSPAFQVREEAEKVLVGFEHLAVPAIRRAARSADPEVSRRAASALKKLEDKLPAERLEVRDADVIETAEFTARGRIDGGQLRVRSRYFGESVLKLTDVRTLRAIGGAAAAEVSVDAALYARVNNPQWLETSVEVTADQRLEVTATGQIDMWPQTPGQYMSGPAGLPGYAAGLRALGPGGVQLAGGAAAPGQLLGRVGPSGAAFVIGEKFAGKAPASGRLYLRIGQSPWGNDSTGSYRVKVSVSGP